MVKRFLRKSGLNFHLTLYKGDKVVLDSTFLNKSAFLAKATASHKLEGVTRWHVRINYKPGFVNEGTYESYQEFRNNYLAFIDEKLIKEFA